MTGPKAGDRISEYVLESQLGSGTFGQVWRAAHHIWKDRLVAIKIPTDAQYVRNLRHEGVALHGLSHVNIVGAIGLDPFADPAYFVMEYVEGCSLRDLIGRFPRGLPIQLLHAAMLGILRGLEHAHSRGVIHGDIKPENILIAGGADRAVDTLAPDDVKLTDFGLGRAIHVTTHSLMQSGSLVAEAGRSISGTLAYMSPEQRDGQPADAESDLYAVGTVLFEMATGERPSGTESPGELRPDLPAWVDRLFTRLYARRDRRLTSASEALGVIAAESVPPIADRGPPPIAAVVSRQAGEARPVGVGGVPGTAARGQATPGRCSACGATTEPDDNYCIRCGAAVSESVPRCMACNAHLSRTDRFCIFCGAPVGAAMA